MTAWSRLEVARVEHESPKVVIYRLKGTLKDSSEAYVFLARLRNETRAGIPSFVINLQEVDNITSAGVGILAACYSSAVNAGRRICLTDLARRADAVLAAVGLLKVMESFATEEDAVRSYSM
jgi:anti-sigma B factor antagonist